MVLFSGIRGVGVESGAFVISVITESLTLSFQGDSATAPLIRGFAMLDNLTISRRVTEFGGESHSEIDLLKTTGIEIKPHIMLSWICPSN